MTTRTVEGFAFPHRATIGTSTDIHAFSLEAEAPACLAPHPRGKRIRTHIRRSTRVLDQGALITCPACAAHDLDPGQLRPAA